MGLTTALHKPGVQRNFLISAILLKTKDEGLEFMDLSKKTNEELAKIHNALVGADQAAKVPTNAKTRKALEAATAKLQEAAAKAAGGEISKADAAATKASKYNDTTVFVAINRTTWNQSIRPDSQRGQVLAAVVASGEKGITIPEVSKVVGFDARGQMIVLTNRGGTEPRLKLVGEEDPEWKADEGKAKKAAEREEARKAKELKRIEDAAAAKANPKEATTPLLDEKVKAEVASADAAGKAAGVKGATKEQIADKQAAATASIAAKAKDSAARMAAKGKK